MIDAFKDIWDAMTPEQREGIAWIARKGDRVIGEGSDEDMLGIAIAAIDQMAKFRADTYEEYREHVIAAAHGLATGLLDGGIDWYLRNSAVNT